MNKPRKGPKRRTDAELRQIFERLPRTPGGCWEWQGGNSVGYGAIGYRGRHWRTHRVAWTVFRGEIPTGKYVCHRCDNRRCCNPDHLWLGSCAENMADMYAKGRQSTREQRMTNVKLSAKDVRAIRALYAAGFSQPTIAGLFDVAAKTISKAVRRESWKHI